MSSRKRSFKFDNVSKKISIAGQVVSDGSTSTPTVSGDLSANTQGNITSVGTLSSLAVTGNISAENYNYANGVSILTAIIANAGALSGQIVTANTNMKGYVDAVTTAWTSNASTQLSQITAANAAIVTANTNMKGYVDGQISTTSSAATTANTNMKGYVDSVDVTKADLSGATFTGAVSITNATQSTGVGTGALIVTGGVSVGANLNVSGDLNVLGTQTTFSSNNIQLSDTLLYLAHDNSGDVLDIGFVASFTNPGYQHTGLVRDASDDVWKLFANVVAEPTTTVDFTNATYSNLRVGNLITTGVTYANGQSILTNVESAITTANTNMKGYVDGQISTTGSSITTANTNMKGYVDGQISTTTTAITTANTAMKGYVDANITAINNSLAGANATMVTSVTGTAPVTSSGGTTPAISMAAATASVNGYMTSTYASKLDGIAAGATNVTNTNQLTNGAGFITSSGTATNLYGAGASYIASSSSGTGYGSAIQIREAGLAGAQASAIAAAPRLAFHWSGVVASSIVMEASGRIAIVNNPGTSYEAFACGVMTGTATNARYADLAENYSSDKKYVPGTVVVFGGNEEITISTFSHDTAVAGVISTNPAHLMNSELDGLPVALQGRVPCRVQGPINKGDRVVTSDVRGVAERLDMTKYQPGCIIGKALGSIPDGEIVTIEVVVGRN
jgi:hypothetical protein